MSVLMGLDKFNKRTAITVVAISLGVALASYGELNLYVPSLPPPDLADAEAHSALGGFIFQSLGILFEATRLVYVLPSPHYQRKIELTYGTRRAIQKLLQGMRMDPLVSLYYYAPVRPPPPPLPLY